MTRGGGSYWASGSLPLIEPEFLGSIIAAASDIALVVSSEGEVLSVLVNSNDESFGNLAHWEGRALAEFLTSESIEKFQTAHAAYLHSEGDARPIELNHVDNAAWQHPVRYTFHRFGQEQCVLLLGRDLRPIAETQQQLVQAQITMEQGYEAQREFDARYRVMLGSVDDAVVFVDLITGRVDEANEKAAALVGLKPEALEGSSFSGLFDDTGGTDLTDALVSATLAEETDPIVAKTTRSRIRTRLTPTLFRAGGRRMLMCVLATEASAATIPAAGAGRMGAMFEDSGDAMIFLRPDGEILAANDTFIDMIGATRRGDVPGSNFSDMLVRGQIDLGLMVGNAGKSGKMRVFATRLTDKLGSKVNVEASVTRIEENGQTLFGLIMRDVNRLDAVRAKQGDDPAITASGQRVVELVGSTSLRDIVAETTDVVEKMCIETAVALTRNNRVAAAEMLGLSRQSLYVKLRKYGLLERN